MKENKIETKSIIFNSDNISIIKSRERGSSEVCEESVEKGIY